MTNSEVAGPPEESWGGGLINLTNKKHFLKYEEHRHRGLSLFGLKILDAAFISVVLRVEAAGNVAEMDCNSPGDSWVNTETFKETNKNSFQRAFVICLHK